MVYTIFDAQLSQTCLVCFCQLLSVLFALEPEEHMLGWFEQGKQKATHFEVL